jgi:hypothetical protein
MKNTILLSTSILATFLLLSGCGDSTKETPEETNLAVAEDENTENMEEDLGLLQELDSKSGYINGELDDIYSDSNHTVEYINKYGKEYFIAIENGVAKEGEYRKAIVTVVENGEIKKENVESLLVIPTVEKLNPKDFTEDYTDPFNEQNSMKNIPVDSLSFKYPYSYEGSISGDKLLLKNELDILKQYQHPPNNQTTTSSEKYIVFNSYNIEEDGTITVDKDKKIDSKLSSSIVNTTEGSAVQLISDENDWTILNDNLEVVEELTWPTDDKYKSRSIDFNKGIAFFTIDDPLSTDREGYFYDMNENDWTWNDDGTLLTYEVSNLNINSDDSNIVLSTENGLYTVDNPSSTEFNITYYEYDENSILNEVTSINSSSSLPGEGIYSLRMENNQLILNRSVKFKGKLNMEEYRYNKVD